MGLDMMADVFVGYERSQEKKHIEDGVFAQKNVHLILGNSVDVRTFFCLAFSQTIR